MIDQTLKLSVHSILLKSKATFEDVRETRRTARGVARQRTTPVLPKTDPTRSAPW
jgi:hypothetical protein